jgi:glutaredoxin 2
MDAQALEMCSQCLLLLEECSELSAVQEMNQSIEDWLQKTIGRVDALLMEVCRKFEAEKYSTVSSEKLLLVIVVKLVQKYMCNNNHNQQQVDLCPHLRAC